MRLPRLQQGCRPLVSKRLTLILTAWLLTGMVVSLVTFLTLFSKEKRRMDTVVNERCANRAKAMQSELLASFYLAGMYSGLVKAYPNCTSLDFETYANTTNKLSPFSQGITYLKNVAGPDRSAAEAELGVNFTQRSNGSSSTFVTRDPAPEYYVAWRSSLPEYVRLFAGYDTLSNPRLAAVATTARDTGDIAVTYPFQSVLGSTSAVAMYYPVYKQEPGVNPTVESLRATLTGFIVATFNVTSLFDDSVDRFKTTLTTLRAYDTTGGPIAAPILMYQTPRVLPPKRGFRFGATYEYELGGRSYRLDCSTDASVGSLLAGTLSWAAVLLLLFLVVALCVYVVTKRFHRKKEEVRKMENLNKEFEAARHKAESADKAKSAFLATMSHELRTPLTGTLGMLDLLRLTPMTEIQSLYVTTMQTSAESLLGCLNDILDFSKIEAGQLRLEEIDLDVAAVVQRVVALFQGKLLEKGLRIELELPPPEDCKAKGDPLRLQQVLSNLLSNAIKFTKSGGIAIRWKRLPCNPSESGRLSPEASLDKGDTIIDLEVSQDAVRARCLSTMLRKRTSTGRSGAVNCTSADEATLPPKKPHDGIELPAKADATPVWYEFSVRDTGMGIAPDAQRNLFKSFVQADDSTTRMYGGTGLGLVICKKLVNAMGGSIDVQSQLNQGTTFTCTVRLQPPSEAIPKRLSIELKNPDMFGLVISEPEVLRDLTPWGVLTPIKGQVVGPGALADQGGVARTATKDFVDVEPQAAAHEVLLSKFLASEAVLGDAAVERTSGESPKEDSRRESFAKSSAEHSKETSHRAGLEAQTEQLEGTGLSGDVKDVPKVLGAIQEKGSRRESSAEEGISSPLLEKELQATRTSSSHSPMKEVETASEISEDTTTVSSVGLSHRSSSSGNQMLRCIGSTSSDEQQALRAEILVAEDNVVNQMLIKRMLKHHGHNVDIVGNGALAVEAVRRKSYTLCLMDLQMPVLDGIHATEEIRRLEGPSSKVPIYILSADVLARIKLQHLSIDGYLTKPIKWDVVLSVINEQLMASKE